MADKFTDRMVATSETQQRYVDPYQQRVFQYDTEQSDVFLARVVNSLLRIFGDDTVINGFEYKNLELNHTDNDILVKVDQGMLIQDLTLIDFKEKTTLILENLSGLSADGRIVAYIKYQFINTIEQNLAYVCLNYISKNGTPRYDWDLNKDRTIVGIFEFTKDEDDNITSIETTDEKEITILGNTYYLYGMDPNKKDLTTYILRLIYRQDSSIDYDKGLLLDGDIANPGPNKYYGTNLDENDPKKGWFTFPAYGDLGNIKSFLQLDDTPDTYSDNQGYFLRVNCEGNGITFEDLKIPKPELLMRTDKDQVINSNKVFNSSVWVLGDLNVRGTVNYNDQENLSVTNNEIVLNSGETGSGVSSLYSGLRVKRGNLQDSLLRYNEKKGRWQVGFEGDIDYSCLATLDDLQIITDEGDISAYKGRKYNIKLINGNIFLEEIGSDNNTDDEYLNICG